MMKPREFGKYLLLDRLAVGGMAEVFIAKATGIEGVERYVAIKKILPTMAEDEEFIRMFIDEARISVQLNHANIVHLHELDKEGDSYFIAMEYVPGRDVRAMLELYREQELLMPIPEAVFIASKICEGLQYAHTRKDARGQPLGIIHRDVSPQNILVSYEGEVKIIDFGIAKAANRSQKTQAGILKGKFGYMSPEQVRGLPIDRRSDIFAVGALLFEMLTGERLFTGESDFSVLTKVREAQVPSMRELNADISPELERVLMKALAKEPDDRYAWAADFQSALTRFLLEGDRIYTARELSASMKELFADDIRKEAERMESFARLTEQEPVQEPETNPFDGISTEAEDEDDGSGKTQLIDSSAVAGLRLGDDADSAPERPAPEEAEATRFDAVNPFFQHEQAAAPAVEEGVVAAGQRVVIGGAEEAYAGATVIGTIPTAEAPISARRNDAKGRGTPSVSHPTRKAPALPREPEAPLANEDADADDTGPISRPPAEPEDLEEDYADGDEAYDDEYDGEEAGADGEAYPDEYDEYDEAEPDEQTPVGHEPSANGHTEELPAEPDTASHSATAPGPATPRPSFGEKLADLRAHLPRWAPLAAGGFLLVLVVGIVAAIALGGGGPSTEPLMVQVQGPSAAAITLDGKAISASQVAQVAPGRHEVRVTAAGYAPVTREVQVRAGQAPPVVEIQMESSVAAKGAPPPAQQAKSPESSGTAVPAVATKGSTSAASAASPAAGSKTAVAESASGKSASPAPEKKTESAPPQPAPTAEVVFHSSQKGVKVEVDGKAIGRTPDVRMADLKIGRTYRYEASREGYVSRSGHFTPSHGGQTVEIALALEAEPKPKPKPKPKRRPEHHHHVRVAVHHRAARHHHAAQKFGDLACASRPNGAEVWVDHRNTGRTTPVAPGRPLRLSVGTHLVRFKLGGRSSPAHKVVIREGDTTRLVMPIQ